MSYFTKNGVDFVALRYEAVYGFSMRDPCGLVKPMIENAAKGIPKKYTVEDVPKGRLHNWIRVTYTYVKDVSSGNLLAIDAEKAKLKSRIYNIVGSEQTTLSKLAETVEEQSGTKVELAPDLIDAEKAETYQVRPKKSIELAHKELGYVPKYDVRRGVEDYIKDFINCQNAEATK
jgi:nucleoside-diphosphate-sugar epimerase